ncbi:MAG: helix-turn-helix domain-containing protein, partial [Solirubrobacteraceae bacterium]
PAQPPARLQALVGGLHTHPAVIGYEHSLYGVQIDLTPRGARSLLGLPACELAGVVVDLEDVLGAAANELIEALAMASSWVARLAVLQRALSRRVGSLETAGDPIEGAFREILSSGGRARIADVASAVGYSRRQLDVRFSGEFGLTPKQLARVVRFERSHRLLRCAPQSSLAVVAAACGYYDQPHMVHEWRSLAGCAPSRWLAGEELPFIQDEQGGALPI